MSEYLTAKQAAAELGISLPTLYAYVSRGLIRSEETAGKSRAKQYHAADIAALKSRKELQRNPAKAVETALHFGAPVLESAITLIQDGRLYYRTHNAIQLAQTHTFEQIAALIWTNNFQTADLFPNTPNPDDLTLVQSLLPRLTYLTPMERFQVVLPLAAAGDLAAFDSTAVAQTGSRILRLMTTTVTTSQMTTTIAHSLQQEWAASTPEAVSLLNTALILCADHELNVSSFTARCVASAGATPYGVVMAGLAALQGSKHGGYTERVEALFREVGDAARDRVRVRVTIASRLRRGEGIPGFGHKLYPDGDPRGQMLLAGITAVFPHKTILAQAIVNEVQQAIGQHPTIDFALVSLAQALDLPPGAALALFALGRTVGWIGHAIEQYDLDQLIRPRARYTGPMPDKDQM
jgi:citrate synthase